MTARRGAFWPLLLIAIGLIFLLSNYGLIAGVSWLAVLNLWPLLLVLIGLDIAFARRWPLPSHCTAPMSFGSLAAISRAITTSGCRRIWRKQKRRRC